MIAPQLGGAKNITRLNIQNGTKMLKFQKGVDSIYTLLIIKFIVY